MRSKSLTIFEDFVVQGQGLEVRAQDKGIVIGPRGTRILGDKDFLEYNNTAYT